MTRPSQNPDSKDGRRAASQAFATVLVALAFLASSSLAGATPGLASNRTADLAGDGGSGTSLPTASEARDGCIGDAVQMSAGGGCGGTGPGIPSPDPCDHVDPCEDICDKFVNCNVLGDLCQDAPCNICNDVGCDPCDHVPCDICDNGGCDPCKHVPCNPVGDGPEIDQFDIDFDAADCKGRWGMPSDQAAPGGNLHGLPHPGHFVPPLPDPASGLRDTAQRQAAPLTDPADNEGAVDPGTAVSVLSLVVHLAERVPTDHDPPNEHWYVECGASQVTIQVRCHGDWVEEKRECLWQTEADSSGGGDGPNWDDIRGTDCTYNELDIHRHSKCWPTYEESKEAGVVDHGRVLDDNVPLDVEICVDPWKVDQPDVRVFNRPADDAYDTAGAAEDLLGANPGRTLDGLVDKRACTDHDGDISWSELHWDHTWRCDETGFGGECTDIDQYAWTWDPNTDVQEWKCVSKCGDNDDDGEPG